MNENAEQKNQLATVAAVLDSHRVVINQGAEQGVEQGKRYLIYGIGGDVTDPESGKSLGKLEIVRGVGRVTHVQSTMATVVSARTRNPPPTTKKITRPGGNSFRSMVYGFGGGEEIIEERQGEAEELPFEGVTVGDKAKPV